MFLKPVIFSGPTAVGKSEIGFKFAREFGVGIFSADSMQVYRGLDIASDKPSMSDRLVVRHGGIDLVDVTQNFSVADWLDEAECCYSKISAQEGCDWIMVGGTGLYIRSFIHGLDNLPASPPELTKKWEVSAPDVVAKELINRAPTLAKTIDLNNPRRVIRALVLLEMGVHPSRHSWQEQGRNVLHIHLFRENSELRKRILLRTQKMFRAGLVDEFRELKERGLSRGHTAWQAIGMDILDQLLSGKISQIEAQDRISQKTWLYAKRQRTWFAKEPANAVINLDQTNSLDKIRSLIIRHALIA